MLDTTLLNSLGSFWSEEGNAVSFYISEAQPENRAHSAAMITAKELARNIARKNSAPELRGIVERLEERADQLRISQPAGLAIFAAPQDRWTEIELPFAVQPQSCVGKSFQLSSLLPAVANESKYFILLVDRSVTRLFHTDGENMIEQMKEVEEERQKVRETGTSRKASDERSKDDDAYHHLRHVGERLLGMLERGMAEGVYVGCRSEFWSELQQAMPEGVVREIVGRFSCDPGLISVQEVIDLVGPEMKKRNQEQLQSVIEDALSGAARGARGVVGAQQVVQALELGETQTIVVTPHAPVAASICTGCDHIDIGRPATCSLCGRPVHRFDDLTEVLMRRAGRGAFDLLIAPEHDAVAAAKGFLAKLRFRADQSRAQVA